MARPRRATDDRTGEASVRSLRPDLVLLLFAPLLGSLITQAGPMSVGLQTRWTMIDPSLYTAYAQHPTDLMTRFGGNDYYWVRLGFLLPAQVFYQVFGPVGGFVAFRYVLALVALVPGFVLLARHFSRAAAWCFVAAVVTSPVILMAWNSDYPDSAALSYLVGGSALAVLPARRTGSAASLRLGAGVLLGLALNAHAASLPIVAVVVVASLLAHPRGQDSGRWWQMAVVAGGIVAVTALLAAVAYLRWGDADIISPTVRQYLRLQRPDQVAIWHSSTWAWAARATYLLVPPALAVAVGVAGCRRRPGGRPGTIVGALTVGAAGSVLAATVVQATGGFSLEYYFYSSLLWWSVPFLLAILLGSLLTGHLPARARWTGAVAIVLVAGLAALLPGPVARFPVVPVGLGLAALVVVLAGLVVGRKAWVVIIGVSAIVVALWLVTVGQPVTAYAKGQVGYPLVDYSAVSRSDSARARDVYRVVSAVPDLVPPAARPGERVLAWPGRCGFPGPPLDPVGQAAAQYLSSHLSSNMPQLTPADERLLAQARPGWLLVLLSNTGEEFNGAETAVARWSPERLTLTTVTSGDVVLHVEVIRLGALAPVNPGGP